MKYFIVVLLLLISIQIHASELLTPSFKITVQQNCPEGDVSCDDVEFVVINRKTQITSTYHGSTMHSTCADGVTPCKFQGYQFSADDSTYFLYDRGFLKIIRGEGEPFLSEEGAWKW